MTIPEGVCGPNVDHCKKVCKLNQVLYGLKNAPKCWNMKFDELTKQLDFVCSGRDACVYILPCKDKITLLLLYVGDIFLVSTKLMTVFEIHDLSEHWTMVQRIFCYRKGTSNVRLRYKGVQKKMTVYADADFASNLCDRKSTFGILVSLSVILSCRARANKTVQL